MYKARYRDVYTKTQTTISAVALYYVQALRARCLAAVVEVREYYVQRFQAALPLGYAASACVSAGLLPTQPPRLAAGSYGSVTARRRRGQRASIPRCVTRVVLFCCCAYACKGGAARAHFIALCRRRGEDVASIKSRRAPTRVNRLVRCPFSAAA